MTTESQLTTCVHQCAGRAGGGRDQRTGAIGNGTVVTSIWAGSYWRCSMGGVIWVHEDPVNKSKRVTNSAGTWISAIELDPWGADTNRSISAAFQPRKFTSYERDGNGSDEAMFRRYNRWHSRFDQPDPYDGSYRFTDPQSFNRYAYVQNDPVNSVDPSGLNAVGPNTRFTSSLDPMGVAYYVDGILSEAWIAGGLIESGSGVIQSHSVGGLTVVDEFYGNREYGYGWVGQTVHFFNTGRTEQPLTEDQGIIVWNALEIARVALNRAECRKYVGEGAYNALRKMWDNRRITYFHGTTFRPEQGPVWAVTRSGLLRSPSMVLSFTFFSDREVDTDAASFGISRIQDRALILLHEARHALCNGCGYAENHDDWDSDIVNACF